jgi:hypothetical protein
MAAGSISAVARARRKNAWAEVPALTKQHVDHRAMLIDSAVEVPLGGATEE